ncbi:UvrD-helicase domain-containing protein [Paracandidimonas soli]|uniref:DNA 3'-5' helicase n=1 Tax=Paracandidimonas soli TaxID=1917182 RepID=A0A4R3VDI7_9BURK|nr:UvrD-helicase domain-containing protein [Paracandidimonas soli]TCV01659.1 ATP-dependent DNA helicase UvrD [Paracandidimonas soli]
MIEGLNPQQQAAVTLSSEHALVLAGAGSGKTRVLTTRMAWLIQTGQASPYSLLAVTFTNKAAREMLTRLSAMLPIHTRGLWVGTFHGLCNRLLRAHHRDAGLSQTFQILDSADQLSAIKRLLKNEGIDDEKYPPRDMQYFINGAKEQGERPDDMEAWDPHRRRQIDIYRLYQEQCEREGVVDFAELLLRAYELLVRNAPIREHYQRRFSHILVDEFQDTNALQYRWLTLLAGAGAPIFAVGDDDQSIYAFRGADVGNMKDFERNYARGRVIRLEQNYRSSGHILDCANALISNNEDRLGKNLWTDSGHGEPVRIIEQPSDQLEAQWIVDEIKAQIDDGSLRQEIAVLYRSNAQSRMVEHALFRAAIPYKVYGGLRFFERQEIKHALAYLRLLDNPHDDTSWLRVVNFPARGIGARTLEQLGDLAREHGISLFRAVPFVPGKGGGNLAAFVQRIQEMRFEAQSLSLPELIEHVLHHSGLLTHYLNDKEGADRIENLKELVNAAAMFAAEENMEGLPAGVAVQMPGVGAEPSDTEDDPFGLADSGLTVAAALSPLAAFLTHASLEAGENQAQAGQDAIQLMTVHAAKGLEFDTVFVTGLEEGLFPHENSILEQGGLEEERRLMYVAITRARKKLYVTLAQSRMLHGKTRYAMRSRFLDELPDAHVKWLSPKVRQRMPESGWHGDAYSRPSTNAIAPMAPRRASSGVTVGEQHFRIGTGVAHPRFGEGTVIGLSGSGQDAQAQIQFRDVGLKTLALGVAKLTILVA